MTTLKDLENLNPLNEANAFIDDRSALGKMWGRDGYLFFRGVFAPEAMAELQRTFLDALYDMGVVDRGSKRPVWNGKSLKDFPFKIEALEKSRVWERFVEHESVKRLMSRIFGEETLWLPMTEYRVTPPDESDQGDILMYRHQDGWLNAGIPFRVCWTPVFDIGLHTGGLVVAEGWNRRGFVHEPDIKPFYPIKEETIPLSDWRRSDYHPGDVVMFSVSTPHSGARNLSNEFRCSMDIRVMPASGARPIIGEITAVGKDTLTIRDQEGVSTTLKVSEDSMIRGANRAPISSLAALQDEVPVGLQVVLSHLNGVVRGVRPQRY